MALFEVPQTTSRRRKQTPKTSKIKLKKGETISDLVQIAQKLVMEKLADYKDASECVTSIEQLQDFFNNTPEGSCIGIDTETTGLDVLSDKLVGISMCNEQYKAIYIPINHISAIYGTRLNNQIPEEDIKRIFKEIFETKHYKYIYHNAKFDIAVFRTFFEFKVPDPSWDTMLCAFLLNQQEEHGLKYLYNKYIAIEDEGVNRFDSLFKGITFDYIPPQLGTIYARKRCYYDIKIISISKTNNG